MTIVIDGSMGEGGGQILRTAIALSSVLLKPVKIINIRAKRKNPGLRPQHITAIRVAATLTDAKTEGVYVGSREIIFIPQRHKGGMFKFNIGTAGSISLVMQAVLPVILFSPRKTCIDIIGGTDVSWSPPIDYMRFVFSELIKKIGVEVVIKLLRRGHYPRGGGRVIFCVDPIDYIKPIKLIDRGAIIQISGLSHAVKLPRHVAIRQAEAAKKIIQEKYPNVEVNIDIEWYEPSKDKHLGPGSGITVWAVCEKSILGGDSIGVRGKPAEKVGIEAALKLIEDLDSGKALDRHLSDMIIPFLALAKGESKIAGARLTMHTYTNVLVVKAITGAEIELKHIDFNNPFELTVKGIGYERIIGS